MAADALSSASITALDAVGTSGPITANTSPNGAQYESKIISDYVTPTATGIGTIGSVYKMVRVPTNIYLKAVRLTADAALDSNASPTLSVDVGVYYSDSTVDGTPTANQGTAVSDNCIADTLLFGDATRLDVRADRGTTAGKWTAAKAQQPLWQAAGLSSDPGGQFDLVVITEAGAATGVSKAFQLQADIGKP